jgi:hypothetical protein
MCLKLYQIFMNRLICDPISKKVIQFSVIHSGKGRGAGLEVRVRLRGRPSSTVTWGRVSAALIATRTRLVVGQCQLRLAGPS